MNKALSTLALIAAAALSLSACNGQAGGVNAGQSLVPSLAPAQAGSRRPHDQGASDLHAGGADFPGYAYNLGSQPAGCAMSPCLGSTPNYAQAPPGSGSLFDQVPTVGTIYYCLTSSGYGRKAFENPAGDGANTATNPCAPLESPSTGFGARQDPLDFVSTAVAMPSTEYATYETDREGGTQGGGQGEPFEIPVLGGPIAIGYRPRDLKASLPTGATLQLSTWTLCAIANGTVSMWNDPAIAADNGISASKLPSKAITFYFRGDSSGTNFVFETHLNAVCHGTWPKPYSLAPYQGLQRNGNPSQAGWQFGAPPTSGQWIGPGGSGAACSPGVNCPANPHFIGESGNAGVLTSTVATPYAIGFIEGAWAKSSLVAVGQALLQSGWASSTIGHPAHAIFVSPTNSSAVQGALAGVTASAISYGGGSDGNALGTTRPECILYVPPSVFTNPPSATYPIVGLAYFLFYSKNNAHYSDLKTLVQYVTSQKPYGQKANAILSQLEYTPLSSSIQTAAWQAATGTQTTPSVNGPCLNS
ncbi:MAG: substrate-binding domain-containing protein [Candidatus Eremiobacteraeota bacterium]|nr:substrate-binding domain-containing protein [Candidatus Eremiobacteraeota bacterium]